jgi:hypothetical protein
MGFFKKIAVIVLVASMVMVNLAKDFGETMGAITCGISSSDEHAKKPPSSNKL